MKSITTKSFSEKKLKSDGIRICVMRRFKPEYEFDVWLPTLAPSEDLLTAYVKTKRMKWKEFSRKYAAMVLDRQKRAIQIICKLAEIAPVTLLCWESSERHCHRRLIKDACIAYRKQN